MGKRPLVLTLSVGPQRCVRSMPCSCINERFFYCLKFLHKAKRGYVSWTVLIFKAFHSIFKRGVVFFLIYTIFLHSNYTKLNLKIMHTFYNLVSIRLNQVYILHILWCYFAKISSKSKRRNKKCLNLNQSFYWILTIIGL